MSFLYIICTVFYANLTNQNEVKQLSFYKTTKTTASPGGLLRKLSPSDWDASKKKSQTIINR